jgi:hypothetical protein
MRHLNHGRLLRLVTGATFLALGATACSNNSSDGPSSSLLTTQQADSISEVLGYDADDEISGATTSGGTSTMIEQRIAEPGVAPVAPSRLCTPTRSPTDPTDTDHDGVPDSVRLTFDCVLSWPLETDSLTGTIDVLDPTPTVFDHAVERIFTDVRLARLFLLSGKESSETRNGIRMSNHDSTTLNQSETNFTTDYIFRDGGTATHVKSWTSTFTADTAGSIQSDEPLPSGLWNIGGTSSWTRGANTYALTVTTNPELHYNATCTTAPRFDSGTLTAVVTKGTQTSTITIQFTACGTYTVTKS